MDAKEQQAVMTIALLAAFADGRNADREREELRRVADALGTSLNTPALVQDVLLKRTSMDAAAAALTTPESRRLAFELAVGVCDVDGLRNEAETRFLAELGNRLGLDQPTIVETAVDADELATAPLPAAGAASNDVVAAAPSMPAAELDRMILNASILNGALELLPQSIASMAIIPLQMKLVYRIGQSHGYEADKTQIRDLLATLGAGLTGQYLEQIGRKLVGGLFGKVAGGMAGSLARGATGAMFSFATTYAIGEVARRYYAGGRVMSADLLKRTFSELLSQGKAMQAQYLPQIEQQARTLDVSRIVQMVRNN
ncbi:MAG TPA: DUF533 domain-containing protein [Burkholderiaceae bacterium]|nr:DUF533 domain-containing protein [Burkholderiaceae bacterium]